MNDSKQFTAFLRDSQICNSGELVTYNVWYFTELNPCDECSHDCMADGDDFVCLCPKGYKLAVDDRTCIGELSSLNRLTVCNLNTCRPYIQTMF